MTTKLGPGLEQPVCICCSFIWFSPSHCRRRCDRPRPPFRFTCTQSRLASLLYRGEWENMSKLNVAEMFLGEGCPDDVAIIDGGRPPHLCRPAPGGRPPGPGHRGVGPRARCAHRPAGRQLDLLGGELSGRQTGRPHRRAVRTGPHRPTTCAAKMGHVGCDALLVDRRVARPFRGRGRVDRPDRHRRGPATVPCWPRPTTSSSRPPVHLPTRRSWSSPPAPPVAPRAVQVGHGNLRRQHLVDRRLPRPAARRPDAGRAAVLRPLRRLTAPHPPRRRRGGAHPATRRRSRRRSSRRIAEDACTGFAGVPSSYQMLLRASSFESRRLPSLRHLQQAGGRLPAAQVERVVRPPSRTHACL